MSETLAVFRVEDCRHVWAKRVESPVLQRLGLGTPLHREQLFHLCLAGPFQPITVRALVGGWRDGERCFAAEITEVDIPPRPIPFPPRKRRAGFGRTMAL